MAYNFIHRLLNAEIPPPESAWNKIAAALDRSEIPVFVEKLSNASIEPPTSVWNKITGALDGTRSEKAGRRITPWMKWSAAAIVTGLVIFSATYLFNTSSSKQMAGSSTPSDKSATTPNLNSDQQKASSGSALSKDSGVVTSPVDLASNNDKQKYSRRRQQVLLPVRHAVIETQIVDNSSQLRESQPNISDNVSVSSAKYIPPPDYYVVTDPNGEKTKISTKFSNAVASLMGGDNVDYLWKSRFDNWKTKLISSPSFIPAAGNFLDIAELKDLIKEQ